MQFYLAESGPELLWPAPVNSGGMGHIVAPDFNPVKMNTIYKNECRQHDPYIYVPSLRLSGHCCCLFLDGINSIPTK